MTFRLSAPEWIHRIAAPRDSASIHSTPYNARNPRLPSSFPSSSVSCIRDMQLDAIVPRLCKCSVNAKAAGLTAPATSQLTHSRR